MSWITAAFNSITASIDVSDLVCFALAATIVGGAYIHHRMH